ncbi:MAG: acyltransferase [Deltaproteobacteria bacterium]|nr:acyltransferase [Deltaproteobacteria bacterium]
MRSKNIEYIAGVDHIRAFASLLVVFHHSFWLIHRKWDPPGLTNDTWIVTDNPIWSLAIETHIVVTMFFVLSGFMFSLVGAGRDIKYLPFMRNRALRVFPVYLALLFFGMAVFPERVNWVGFLSSASFMGNSMAALNLWPVSTTFWTVAVELQFYIIFPFLNTFLNREGAKPLLYLLAFAIGLRLVGFLIGTSVRDMNYWHLPGRIDAFLLGMLLARAHLKYRVAARSPWLIVPGLVAFFGCTFTLNHLGGWPAQVWWKALWPTVEAMACVVFVFGYLSFARRLPSFISRALAYLGALSFSTYLCHFMVMQGLYDHGLIIDFYNGFGWSAYADAAANTLLIVIPASLLLSFLAYNGIEAPFMRLRGVYVKRDRDQRDDAAPKADPHDDAAPARAEAAAETPAVDPPASDGQPPP